MLINLRNALMAAKRLPYNAEVEYLRVDAVGPYIVIDGVTYCNAVGTYYAFTISSGGVVTHDLIPVRLGNTGYMYDRITNKRFGNAGTGDFVVGPDVVPVEWLSSSGTQYIDTGVVATSDTHINVRFSDVTTTGTWLFGARRAYQNGALGVFTTTADNRWSRARGSFVASTAFTYTTTGVGVCTFDYNGAKFTATRELQPVTETFTDTTSAFSSSPYTIYLWTVNLAGSAGYIASAKFYSTDIWDGNNQVRSFRPVRVGSGTTWEGAMIDTLTRRVYRNAGTGAFAYGNDLKYPIRAE